MSKVKRTIWLSLAAGFLVMLVLGLLTDLGETGRALGEMDLRLLPLLLVFSAANYVTRFGKWEYFLRKIDIRLPLRDSLGIFLGGFAFSITPGKLGEVFKSVLIKQIDGASVARTAPVVFAERYTDLGGLVILASLGFYGSGTGGISWLAGLLLLLVLFVLISSRRVERLLLGMIARFAPLADKTASVSRALESARILLQARNLPVLLAVSAISWFWECWALVYALKAFGMTLGLFDAVFIYSLATLAGALAFLPGGLGVTEGSLVMLLIAKGIEKGSAGAATMLIRLTTLWFAVGIGVLALIWLDRRWKLGSRLWGGFQEREPDCLPVTGGDGK